MGQLKVGYARCGRDPTDETAEREALAAAGVAADRIYIDVGLAGANRPRPGLGEAMAACRAGDTLMVTSLDRLARSIPDARDIVANLTRSGVVLNIGGSIHDLSDPVSAQLEPVLVMVADFQTALIRGRTAEGMRMARTRGRLKGRPPKLSRFAEAHMVALFEAGEHTTAEIAELLAVSRSTVYRAVKRAARAKLVEQQ